ncbi:MAG: hypothetical protein KBI01_00545, partial [Oscillospiraceae bacterium]|nr:hypothetical protein [Oscillospiraceae bacterium]
SFQFAVSQVIIEFSSSLKAFSSPSKADFTSFEKGSPSRSMFINQFAGSEAILVDNSQQLYITKGLKESFQAMEGIEALML